MSEELKEIVKNLSNAKYLLNCGVKVGNIRYMEIGIKQIEEGIAKLEALPSPPALAAKECQCWVCRRQRDGDME